MTPPVLLAGGAVAMILLVVVVALLMQRRHRARAVPPGPRTVAELVRQREATGPPAAPRRAVAAAPVEDVPPVTAPRAAPAPRTPVDAAPAAAVDRPVETAAGEPAGPPAAGPAPYAPPVPAPASFHDAPWRRGAHLTGEHTLVALMPGSEPPAPEPAPEPPARRWSAPAPRGRRGSAAPDRAVEARPVATTASGEGVEPGEPPSRRARGGLSVVPQPGAPRSGSAAPDAPAERSRLSTVARIGAIGAAAVAGAVARHRAEDVAPPAAPAPAAPTAPEPAAPAVPSPDAPAAADAVARQVPDDADSSVAAAADDADERVAVDAVAPDEGAVRHPPAVAGISTGHGTGADPGPAGRSVERPPASASGISDAPSHDDPDAPAPGAPDAAHGGAPDAAHGGAPDAAHGGGPDAPSGGGEPRGTSTASAGPGPAGTVPREAEQIVAEPIGSRPREVDPPAAVTGPAATGPADDGPVEEERVEGGPVVGTVDAASPVAVPVGSGVVATAGSVPEPVGPTERPPAPDRRDPTRVAAEQAAADLALLRTFGASDLGSRPGRAPDVALVSAARPGPEPQAGAAQPVRFRVVRRGGEPVAGVAVALLDDHGRETAASRADADGAGALTAPRPGSFVLVATAAEHQPGAVAVTVAGGPVEAELLLVRSAALVGTVSGEDGAISGARVTLVQDGEVVDAARSDPDGRFRIAELAAGEYAVSVAAAGCQPDVALVAVPDEAEAVHDVELAPAGVAAH